MRKVLLVGNPNTGKTTLFNALTCSDEHVGNWHGVTVENKEKSFKFGGEEFLLVDTPGIYSLCPLSFEEEVAAKTIFANKDVKIINICDANNLERNLFLTLCLLERGCDVVLAVNVMDKNPINKVDFEKLSKALGVDVVQINAQKKIGLETLKQKLTASKKVGKLPYLDSIVKTKLPLALDDYSKIKAFEKDERFFSTFSKQEQTEIFASVPQNSVETISKMRFNFVEKVMASCVKKSGKVYGASKLDKIFLNRWLAFPVFFLVLGVIFFLTFFSLGAFLSDCLSQLLNLITSPILNLIENSLGTGAVFNFFASALFGGVSTVLSFLPQVVLLFFFLSVLEDSGYMSRIAFIFEDILGKIGLSGKSVYTLLMGFGCSTSAIMTSRNMDDKNAKIKTAMLCPYMSCSAKIPIYTVVGGAFFGAKNVFCIMGLYVLGVVVAILISKILDLKVLKSQKQTFILEFPPYRTMSIKRVGKVLWKNVKEFTIRVGSIMVAMNIIVWILANFSFRFAYVAGKGGSMLESFGKVLAPIFSPLGFGSWAIVCALLAGLVAKEVVVSSIAMFNGVDSGAAAMISQSILLPSSLVFFSSRASVLSFLVFCLLYTPCMGSISMLLQEIGKKWTLISIAIQFLTAYVVAFVVFNIAFAIEIFGFLKVFLVCTPFILTAFAVWFLLSRRKRGCAHCDKCGKCGRG